MISQLIFKKLSQILENNKSTDINIAFLKKNIL